LALTSQAMRGVPDVGAAGIRLQAGVADAVGTKERIKWNVLDRYDPDLLPR
jgi:hypothetical protein